MSKELITLPQTNGQELKDRKAHIERGRSKTKTDTCSRIET